MKAKYVFIWDTEATERTRVHVVMVGISNREQKKCTTITNYAQTDADVFWHRWDAAVCDFLQRLSESIYTNLTPVDAFRKFVLRNVRKTSLDEIIRLITSRHDLNPSYPSHDKNPKP